MGEFGQRVGLIHKLGELRAAEELPDRGHYRADVDQDAGGDGLGAQDAHPLPDHPLQAQQADAKLVLNQLADGAYPAVAQVVNVVRAVVAVVNQDDMFYYADDVFLGQRFLALRDVQPQPLVELIPPHVPQVVARRVEKEVPDQLAGVFNVGRVSGAQLAVDVEQCLRLVLDQWLAL